MPTFVQELLSSHPKTFEPNDTLDLLPAGWQALMTELVDDLALVLGREPSHRVFVTSVRERNGGLRVAYDLRPAVDGSEPVAIVVHTLVAAAERDSLQACRVCGGEATVRRTSDGAYVTRCVLHANGAEPIGRRHGSQMVADESDFTHVTCAELADTIIDETTIDEVPPGWRPLCCDLLRDFAAIVRAAPGHRLRLRRLHAHGQALRCKMKVGRDFPAVPARAIGTTLRRAGAGARVTCPGCGSRDGRGGLGLGACTCQRSKGHGSGEMALGAALEAATMRPCPGSPSKSGPRHVRLTAAPGSSPTDDDPFRVAIYSRADVAAALGLHVPGEMVSDLEFGGRPGGEITEQQARLQRIFDAGDDGRWRTLARPTPRTIAAVAALARAAPHMVAFFEFVVRHLRASQRIDLPISLPPVLLVGPPGTGKTWACHRLAEALGLPHRVHLMNTTSTSDTISGAHPVWRNSAPGLPARLLLGEATANSLILVDEFDKCRLHNGADPYGAFFTLFEPTGSRRFVDEYLQFPLDASRILWVASANEVAPIPEAIRDRLTLFHIPTPGPSHIAAVIDSTYADANSRRRAFFTRRLDPAVRDRLTGRNPRSIRVLIEDAMVRAAAAGRRRLKPDDVVPREKCETQPIGFVRFDG